MNRQDKILLLLFLVSSLSSTILSQYFLQDLVFRSFLTLGFLFTGISMIGLTLVLEFRAINDSSNFLRDKIFNYALFFSLYAIFIYFNTQSFHFKSDIFIRIIYLYPLFFVIIIMQNWLGGELSNRDTWITGFMTLVFSGLLSLIISWILSYVGIEDFSLFKDFKDGFQVPQFAFSIILAIFLVVQLSLRNNSESFLFIGRKIPSLLIDTVVMIWVMIPWMIFIAILISLKPTSVILLIISLIQTAPMILHLSREINLNGE